MNKSKYKDRRTYYTSNIFSLPSWLVTTMIIGTVLMVSTIAVTGLSNGSVDPFRITESASMTLTNSTNPETKENFRKVITNFEEYKDVPYDYKAEVETTFDTMDGEFTPTKVSKGSQNSYTFISDEFDVMLGAESPVGRVIFTTDKIKDAKNIQTDELLEFKGTITSIGVSQSTRQNGDGNDVKYPVYTFYVSDITEKGGDK